MKVKSRYSTAVFVDGAPVKITVKRFDIDEFSGFALGHQFLLQRQRGVKDVPEDETDEAREARERRNEEFERHARDFYVDAISKYVAVDSGEIFEEVDGRDVPITEGKDLVRLFGGRMDVLNSCVNAIWIENTLSEKEKNVLSPRSGSESSSDMPAREVPGPRPARTAGRAGRSAIVDRAPATASTAEFPSGSTGAGGV